MADTSASVKNVKDLANQTVMHDLDKGLIVSFVDDDINPRVWDVYRPIFESEGVPSTVAAITDRIDTSRGLSWNQLNYLKDLGWTVCNHTHTHTYLGNIASESELDREIGLAKEILDSRGFDGNIIVYPFGSKSELSLKVSKKHTVLGMGGYSQYNTMPLDTYEISRFGIADLSTTNVDDYKAIVDNAPANSWLIFYGHVVTDLTSPEKIEGLRQLIQYIKSKNIDILNVKDAMDKKANILDVGGKGKFAKIGRDGSVLLNNFSDTSFDNNTPVTYFPLGESKVYFSVHATTDKGFPEVNAGIFTTFRIPYTEYPDKESVSYQTFEPYNRNMVYQRRWDYKTDRWTNWEIIAQPVQYAMVHSMHPRNAFSNNAPITAFTRETISSFYFNSSGSTGMPVTAGILTTYRMRDDAWSRQECREYQGHGVWSRLWVNGAWGEWVKISAV